MLIEVIEAQSVQSEDCSIFFNAERSQCSAVVHRKARTQLSCMGSQDAHPHCVLAWGVCPSRAT